MGHHKDKASNSNQAVVRRKMEIPFCPKPPQLASSIVMTRTVRWLSTASQQPLAVTYTNVGDWWVQANTAGTNFYQMANAVRIKRIRAWCQPASSLFTPITLTIQFAVSNNSTGVSGVTKRFTDTSMSTEPAFLDVRPPAGSSAALWQSSTGTNNCFSIYCPINTLVDITYDMVLRDDGSAVAAASSGLGVGNSNAYRGLDALSTAGSNWAVQGYYQV